MGLKAQVTTVALDDSGEATAVFSGGSEHRPTRLVALAVGPLLKRVGGTSASDTLADSAHSVTYSLDGADSSTNFASDSGDNSYPDTGISGEPVCREEVVLSLTADDDNGTNRFRRVTLVTSDS